MPTAKSHIKLQTWEWIPDQVASACQVIVYDPETILPVYQGWTSVDGYVEFDVDPGMYVIWVFGHNPMGYRPFLSDTWVPVAVLPGETKEVCAALVSLIDIPVLYNAAQNWTQWKPETFAQLLNQYAQAVVAECNATAILQREALLKNVGPLDEGVIRRVDAPIEVGEDLLKRRLEWAEQAEQAARDHAPQTVAEAHEIGLSIIDILKTRLKWFRLRAYMKMDPPPDSDKPLPVPAGDNSCYLHTAANMLAGAGFGNGATVQARADDIWANFSAHYGAGGGSGGWIDSALQWWLASTHNTWPANPYTLVSVYGNKTKVPWANTDGARDIGNELRSCNMVGLSISWPTGHGGSGGHAITAWGDSSASSATLTTNPSGVRVTDSDTDSGGNVQAYTYDSYTSPNPGGSNEGNGWYFNYGTNHPFIKHIATLSPTGGGGGAGSVRVTGSYKIHQRMEGPATDLHYQVGTDVDILTYRTWISWQGTPKITEAQPRRQLTVDWKLEKPVPKCTWVTINTEFVEPSWNAISYKDVHFTYPTVGPKLPVLTWKMETPLIEKAETIPNVTGGYVIGSFDVYDPERPDEPAVSYRFVHQYLFSQSPERHTFLLSGTRGFNIRNLAFGHSYGYPTPEALWRFENWMTQVEEQYALDEKPVAITIDWKGRLPYPEGDRGIGG